MGRRLVSPRGGINRTDYVARADRAHGFAPWRITPIKLICRTVVDNSRAPNQQVLATNRRAGDWPWIVGKTANGFGLAGFYYERRVERGHLAYLMGRVFAVPDWFLIALFAVLPVRWMIRRRRKATPDRCPECDPQSLESNVPGLYLAGVIVAGARTNEIFIENGRFHGRQIAQDIEAKLAGRASVNVG